MVVTHRDPVVPLLTSNIQLCLAHYCDTHGPTPLMVTEGLPVQCTQCLDDLSEADRPKTSASNSVASTPAINDALRKLTLQSSRSSSVPVSERDAQYHQASLAKPPRLPTVATNSIASAVETPPQSPRRAPDHNSDNAYNASIRRDSSFRRTYDDKVTKRANPCQNCALTLPRRQNSDSSPREPPNSAANVDPNPTLRTRAPYARVYGNAGDMGDLSPPSSHPQSQCTSDAEDEVPCARPSNPHRPASSASRSSTSSRSGVAHHTHYLDYTSAHEPLVPNTYSMVRASCLRTLSFETLPRKPETSQQSGGLSSPTSTIAPSYPSSPITPGPGYITSAPTPQSAAAGGPIFFGDPIAGYTTAYIFRIPDRHARGRKRVYAFMALSTHRERLAMKAFNFLAAAFRDLSAWIQELAEVEAEREREREEDGSAVAAINAAYSNGGFGGGGPHDSGIGLGLAGPGNAASGSGSGLGGGHSAEHDRERDPNVGSGSSFLTGGGRSSGFLQRMGGSMGPGGFAPKARGLAELVGLPDFFIQLHSRFVRLLLELGVILGA